MQTEKKILVLHTAFLGDLLLAIPFFLKLRQLYPEYKLDLICRKHVGEFFTKTQLVDRVFEVKKGDSAAYKQIQNMLSQTSYELFFCPHQSLRSFFFSLKVHAALKIAYKLPFNIFGFSHRVKKNKSLPESLRVMQLLIPVYPEVEKQIAKLAEENKFYQTQDKLLSKTPEGFRLDLSERISSDKFSLFSLKKKLEIPDKANKWIYVFPGSVWETKKWSLEHYKSLVGMLLAKDYKVFLMGAPGEEKLCESIFQSFRTNQNIFNYSGLTSVYESALLISQCDLVIGNDSASSHLATVCDKKLITFFGPTVLSFGYRPWGDKVYVFQNESLKCRPCGPHGHQKCPIGTHECMKSLKPLEVFQFIEKII